MNPRDLETKVQKIFTDRGYLTDRSLFNFKRLPNGKYRAHKNDFAHVFDLIGYKQDSPILLIQVCLKSVLKAHMNKIDEKFGMYSCLQFKVIIAAVIVERKGKRNSYRYEYYEKLPEGWVHNTYL